MELGVIFGGYRFDRSTGRLWSGKREVRLTPKAAAVLGALVTRAGDLVTKEELLASVWSDTAVSDDALTSCVQELRKALADNPKQPRFIETRHRRGYRFIPRVSDARAAPGRMSRRAIPTELMTAMTRHTVRYARATDGVRLAWAESGSGIPLVKAATWLTHLEYDLDSPVWRHWTDFLSSRFRYVRYDERGCGMSDWDIRDLTLERRVDDLEMVVDAAGIADPFVLLGISHGACVCLAYAARHPERVARMVLCGGYARGALRRGDGSGTRVFEAIITLADLWGSDNAAFREVFTSRFIPAGTDEQLRWFNDLCRKTTSPQLAGPLLRSRAETDVSALLGRIRTPTLIIHARDDAIAPLSEGRMLASEIAGAQFVELDSRNHVLLEHEPAWARFTDAVLEFTGQTTAGHAAGGQHR